MSLNGMEVYEAPIEVGLWISLGAILCIRILGLHIEHLLIIFNH